MANRLHEIGQSLESKPIFKEGSRLSRWTGARFNTTTPGRLGEDVIDFLSKKEVTAPKGIIQKILSWLPKNTHQPIRTVLASFNKLPMVKNLSTFVKGDLFFNALFGSFGVINDTVSGFLNTEGDLGQKLGTGITKGFQAAARAVTDLFASAGIALLIPKLLGVSALGPVGIIAGTLGSMVLSFFTGDIVNRVLNIAPDEAAQKHDIPSEHPTFGYEDNLALQAIEQGFQGAKSGQDTQGNPWLNEYSIQRTDEGDLAQF